jgi:hypothetical protein
MSKINSDKFTFAQMAELLHEWSRKYHTDKKGNIVFQNRDLLSNVRLKSDFLHKNHNISGRGFSNLPDAITSPEEVWGKWKDPTPKHQDIVIRNYILFDKELCYVCQTESGEIIKALIVPRSKIGRHRKGIILLRK